MIFIKNDNTNPYINHAIEEYMLKNFQEDCFMLWRNERCILIGKNQNTLSEINMDYVKKHNLPVVRRMSGGGAIFNDLGNLHFTFIANNSENRFADFSKFTYPIINALKKIGINADLSGRNDLTIDGKKFSGNAQYNYKNKILHHGSILFSANMSDLTSALKVKDIKFQDKSVKSVGSRVTNISEHLKSPMSLEEFKEFLANSIISEQEKAKIYELTKEDWIHVKKISDEKYSTWEWNYGKSPNFNYFNEKKFLGGIVQANINVEKGLINSIKLYGDFFSESDVIELENVLTGIRYNEKNVRDVLKNISIEKYMSNINEDNLIQVMFN
ncbi:lipoate--protein ligase [Clostridium carboxidivorans P7]|uniref:lipoate--protein ligase n=1 Tax=Clostridium carboxidivorans TaxID=217159 RepID=UPI0001D39376|nr:lipoate--protein ligase [Clostridium carboxidivorans]AKN33613.1 lipoate--protein ligase [Clostridium carboxidivorans P7]EFG86798.1 lipoyltransferase and lipoate-protein ligase [Clostridium carboxidivorans P7]